MLAMPARAVQQYQRRRRRAQEERREVEMRRMF